MRKGRTLARLTAGMVVVAVAAACGGGDAPEAGGDEAAPAASTPAQTPGTAAPGGDPTTAPATDTGGPAAPSAGAAGGGDQASLVAQGQQLYSSSICVSCHGPTGGGTPLAPSFTDDEWLWVDPAGDMQAQVATIIKTGVSQPKDPAHVAPMLPYGGGPPLEESQVQALSAYVVSLGG